MKITFKQKALQEVKNRCIKEWSDSATSRAFAFHRTDLGSIPNTPYNPVSH